MLEILILDHGTAAVDLPTTISKVESPFGHRLGRFRVTFGRVSFLSFLPPLTPKRRPGRRIRSFGCRPGVCPASAGIPNRSPAPQRPLPSAVSAVLQYRKRYQLLSF